MNNSPSKNRLFHEILLEKMEIFAENSSEQSTQKAAQFSQKSTQTSHAGPFLMDFYSEIHRFSMGKSSINRFTPAPHLCKKPPFNYHRTPKKIETTEAKYKVSTLSVSAQLSLDILGLGYDSQRLDSTPKDNTYIRVSEVKTAFRRLARRLHPDLNPSRSGQEFTSIKQLTDNLLKELASLQATE